MKVRRSVFVLMLMFVSLQSMVAFRPQDSAFASQPSASYVLTQRNLDVDFTTLVTVPGELRVPIKRALDTTTALLPKTSRLTVSVVRRANPWAYVAVVPTSVVEAKWETELGSDEFIELLGKRDATNAWTFAVRGSPEFLRYAREVPRDFVDFSYLFGPPADAPSVTPQALEYKFPWENGKQWFKTQGWHQTNALDFQPVNRSNPAVDFVVKSAEAGTLKLQCGGRGTSDPWTASLRIEHEGGQTTSYVHLDANTIPYQLLNHRIDRNTTLGLLYNGRQGASGDLQYSTPCGSGTSFHLHFVISKQAVIEGRSTESVSSSQKNTIYTSTNGPKDPTPPPPPNGCPQPVEGIVVSEDGPNAERGGITSYLYDVPASNTVCNGHAYWTGSDNNASANTYIKWKPPLDRCGNWEVLAYLPYFINGRDDTTNAVYKIRFRNNASPASGDVNVAVNQGQSRGWRSLGTYAWSKDAHAVGEYVYLDDTTGEASPIRSVNLDDLRWVWRGPNPDQCNIAPNPPRLIAPANGSTVDSRLLSLQWQDMGDPDNYPRDRRDFGVEIRKEDGSWAQATPWQFEASWSVTVPSDGTYLWRVISGDGLKASAWTEEWRVTVQTPVTTANLALAASESTVKIGQVFTVDIRADVGTRSVDTVDAYLSFDPAALEVVDAGGTPTTMIERNGEVFPGASINAVDNATGRIDFSATKTTAPALTGAFRAATVRFRAKTPALASAISFIQSGSTNSDLLLGGTSLEPTFANTNVTVEAGIELRGHVDLQNHGVSGTTRWITPMFRECGKPKVEGVKVFQAGTTTLVASGSPTTDENGDFTLMLGSLAPGSYDIQIKALNSLSIKKENVQLPSSERIDFGLLLAGDSSGDDKINGADISTMVPTFLKANGESGYVPCADVNGDAVINGGDVSTAIGNFLRFGPTDGSIPQPIQSTRPVTSPVAVGLSLELPDQPIEVGSLLTITLTADLASASADTVDAYLDFDPDLLTVVDADGSHATSMRSNDAVFSGTTVNTVDNETGQINFSASRYTRPFLTGRVAVATLTVRVDDTFTSTGIRFARNDARWSDVLLGGTSLAPQLVDSTLTMDAPQYNVFLPLIVH